MKRKQRLEDGGRKIDTATHRFSEDDLRLVTSEPVSGIQKIREPAAEAATRDLTGGKIERP